MQILNLPEISAQTRMDDKGIVMIFDAFRKKYVKLTPEEWVRQHFLYYLAGHLGYPATLLVVEASLVYNGMKKRFDILAHDTKGNPLMVIECKAPTVVLTQKVFDQVALYNMTLTVPYVVVTNGMQHYACHIDHQAGNYRFLESIPAYRDLSDQS
jgi:hypothetical protein